MMLQRVARTGGVRKRCRRGVGATPVLRTSRVGSAALVAPTPRTLPIQKISSVDILLIRHGYKPYRLSTRRRSVSQP